jgi:RNA polymerase sigma factor (sigma-70 family)
MLIKVNGIGKRKLKYQDANTIEFDTLPNYLKMAKKAISKFANNIYDGLAKKMLKDEEAISEVANAMMMGDWRWDEDYQNEKGTKKNRYSYRNQCALWAIQSYATKNNRKFKNIKNIYSFNFNIDDENTDCYSVIADSKAVAPDEEAEEKENKQLISSLVEDLLDNELLTDRQKDYIRLYYFEDQTFEKIGKKYGVTREAVRQGLNKALELIRSFAV